MKNYGARANERRRLSEALDRLADKIPSGHLLAGTGGADFHLAVIYHIEKLEAVREAAEKAYANWQCLGTDQQVWTKCHMRSLGHHLSAFQEVKNAEPN